MARQSFDQELGRPQDMVLTLGTMAEEALVHSVKNLKERDLGGSRQLISGDQAISRLRYAIEGDAIALIATRWTRLLAG